MKTVGLMRKLHHRGAERRWMFTFTAAAYKLVRSRPKAQSPKPEAAG